MTTFPLAPGATIGILGGGQLGRMLAMAAARLGFDAVILTPETDSPASRVAARLARGQSATLYPWNRAGYFWMKLRHRKTGYRQH